MSGNYFVDILTLKKVKQKRGQRAKQRQDFIFVDIYVLFCEFFYQPPTWFSMSFNPKKTSVNNVSRKSSRC